MVPRPVALGLTLCDYLVIEEGTRKVSLVGVLTKLTAEHFPYVPPPFFVHAALTDGLGAATIDLVATRLDTGEEIGLRRRTVRFVNRLGELHVVFRINDWSFPVAGSYQITLLVDREWVAQRRIRILLEAE